MIEGCEFCVLHLIDNNNKNNNISTFYIFPGSIQLMVNVFKDRYTSNLHDIWPTHLLKLIKSFLIQLAYIFFYKLVTLLYIQC